MEVGDPPVYNTEVHGKYEEIVELGVPLVYNAEVHGKGGRSTLCSISEFIKEECNSALMIRLSLCPRPQPYDEILWH